MRVAGILAALLLACGADTSGDSATASCDDSVTYETFGRGFMTQHCQPCHASTTAERNGAPAEVVFDTEDDVRTWSDRILARATGPTPDMPPRGGVSDDDRVLVEQWLTCE